MSLRNSCFLPVLFCCLAGWSTACSQTVPPSSFKIIPLGVRGGLDESNLSAYMVAPEGSNAYICLDAGTLYSGIRKAVAAGLFRDRNTPTSPSDAGVPGHPVDAVKAGPGHPVDAVKPGPGHPVDPGYILRNYIKAYFISHAHLDHVAGLIINSPDDTAKAIFGLPPCLDVLKEKYFTWESWANFADAGEKPLLNKYHYSVLVPGQEEDIPHTDLHVTAYPLSHGAPYQSTAFLVRHEEAFLLYLGDTGADTVEHSDKLHLLWEAVSPLLKTGKLKAIMIEVSFPDEQPVRQLFGHLTPALLMKEMQALGQLSGEQALNGFPVLITHIKPSGDQETRIRRELASANPLHIRLIFPAQAARLDF